MRLYLAVFLLVLAACSSAPEKSISSIPMGEFLPFTLVYQSGRQGTVTPCETCSTTPFGGLDRESNALESIRSRPTWVLYADAGNMFVPEREVSAEELEKFRTQSRTLLEAFNLLSLDIYAPGPTDWKLGRDHLKALAKSAAFKFVATNIMDENDRRIFPAFQLVQRGPYTFAFLSVLPEGWYGKDVHATNVKSALNKWVWQASIRADFVIVLSQLGDAAEDKKILERYPQVQIVVGNDPRVHSETPTWVRGRVAVDGYRHGYYLGKLSFEVQSPFSGFYLERELARSKERHEELERELASQQEVTRRSEIQAKIINLKQSHPETKPSRGSRMIHEFIALDRERFGKPNDITLMLNPGTATMMPAPGGESAEEIPEEVEEGDL